MKTRNYDFTLLEPLDICYLIKELHDTGFQTVNGRWYLIKELHENLLSSGKSRLGVAINLNSHLLGEMSDIQLIELCSKLLFLRSKQILN